MESPCPLREAGRSSSLTDQRYPVRGYGSMGRASKQIHFELGSSGRWVPWGKGTHALTGRGALESSSHDDVPRQYGTSCTRHAEEASGKKPKAVKVPDPPVNGAVAGNPGSHRPGARLRVLNPCLDDFRPRMPRWNHNESSGLRRGNRPKLLENGARDKKVPQGNNRRGPQGPLSQGEK